jgi:hypothetical protein
VPSTCGGGDCIFQTMYIPYPIAHKTKMSANIPASSNPKPADVSPAIPASQLCAGGGALNPAAEETMPPAPSPLPTGEKRYHLYVASYAAWDTDQKFRALSNFLNEYANDAPPSTAFVSHAVCNYPKYPLVSRRLLKSDGFYLGNLVVCSKDQEAIEQSRYAVYEVVPCAALRNAIYNRYFVLN